MADMKVEEAERRARGLPTKRDSFQDDDIMSDEDQEQGDGDDDDGEEVEDDTKAGRFMDVTRARRVQDPTLDADGSRWPRPG